MIGIITTYFQSKSYGFITGEDGVCRFFHASSYFGGGMPLVGTEVTFSLAPPTKIGKDKQCAFIKPIEGNDGGVK